MLKKVLFVLILVTTVLRFGNMVSMILSWPTNLPLPSLFITFFIIAYGVLLIFKRIFLNTTLRNYLWFFIVQSLAIAVNILYIKKTTPLKLSVREMISIGTFLDILIAAVAVYFCIKNIRKSYKAIGARTDEDQ